MMQRSEVYRAIDSERAYQERQQLPNCRNMDDWLRSIYYYMVLMGGKDSPENKAEQLRKLAALAVAALEQYGCEPRKGYEVEPWQPAIPWELVPDEAEWIVLSPYGDLLCAELELFPAEGDWHSAGWEEYVINPDGTTHNIPIPLGLDWRQCKWRRPEVGA